MKKLSADEERLVRVSIYGQKPRTEFIKEKFLEILVVPKQLSDLYKKEPEAVAALVVQIVEGASPDDSSLAAGYAMELLFGPGQGLGCVQYYDRNTYDRDHKAWETTPRKHWLKILRKPATK